MVEIGCLWDASYMSEDASSPLQRFVAKLLVKLPHARDWYDKRYQERTASKGKPLYDIERGKSKNPSRSVLRELAEITGEPLVLFVRAADGEEVDPVDPAEKPEPDLPPPPDVADNDQMVAIKKLDLSLSMGPGTLIDGYVDAEPVWFDANRVRGITRSPVDRLRIVRGIGDSMYPTLNGGDEIMIDTTQRALVRQDGIYWVSIYGAAGIKRLRSVGPKRILVVSDNPTIENYEVDANDVRIEGRAIWFARDL